MVWEYFVQNDEKNIGKIHKNRFEKLEKETFTTM